MISWSRSAYLRWIATTLWLPCGKKRKKELNFSLCAGVPLALQPTAQLIDTSEKMTKKAHGAEGWSTLMTSGV